MAQQKQPEIKPITRTITNFGGRLTRIVNGNLDSGFAKFVTSFGYDPFSKPMNLTWLSTPTILYQTGNAGTGVLKDLPLAGKMRWLGETDPTLYTVGSAGTFYKIQVNSNTNASTGSIVGIGSVAAGGPTFNYGASIDFFGSAEKVYVGSDGQINSINFDGSGDVVVGSAGNYAANLYRPLKQFAGRLLFGNGPTIGAISATGTVTSSVIGVSSAVGNIYSELSPPLPVEARVRDLDVSVDNNYALITASNLDNENLFNQPQGSRNNTVPSDGTVYGWNGSDKSVTTATVLPTNFISALQTYMQSNLFFTADGFGAGLSDGVKKILTLPSNKAPAPNATGVNGNFLYWVAPEKAFRGDTTGPTMVGSMYYFGSLDEENPKGLYRMCRIAPTTGFTSGAQIVDTPFNALVNLSYSNINTTSSSVVSAGIGQHYISTYQINNANSSVFGLYKFNIPALSTDTTPLAVYETQTELFSKRVGLSQIRVYTEPVVAGNSFVLDLIGSGGTVIDNGSFTYTFGDPIDKGVRINFNPNMDTVYALGVRITNLGNTNMTIKKIEIDLLEEGK